MVVIVVIIIILVMIVIVFVFIVLIILIICIVVIVVIVFIIVIIVIVFIIVIIVIVFIVPRLHSVSGGSGGCHYGMCIETDIRFGIVMGIGISMCTGMSIDIVRNILFGRNCEG